MFATAGSVALVFPSTPAIVLPFLKLIIIMIKNINPINYAKHMMVRDCVDCSGDNVLKSSSNSFSQNCDNEQLSATLCQLPFFVSKFVPNFSVWCFVTYFNSSYFPFWIIFISDKDTGSGNISLSRCSTLIICLNFVPFSSVVTKF